MKKILLSLFLLPAFAGKGQNLVPNGDFEQYSGCPNDFGQIDSALFWMNPAINIDPTTPDYYNQCSPGAVVSVPVNWGVSNYQPAYSGGAYAGIYLYQYFVASNAREYIEVPLTSSLISNTCYHFEMYINLADQSEYTTDDIGIYFSDTALTGITNALPLPFIPQLENAAGNYPDSLNWTLVSGNYTANGGESFIIIGNFKYDATTNLVLVNNGALTMMYCFIDDVSLTPCTGIEEQNQNSSITIYPNPVKDELTVNCYSLSGKKEIVITDILGKEIYRNQFQTLNFKLQTLNFIPGIYFLEINTGKEIFRKKFLKE